MPVNVQRCLHFLLPVGGAMTMTEYWPVDVFRLRLMKHLESEADLTLYSQVRTASCFMVKHRNLPHRQGNAVE